MLTGVDWLLILWMGLMGGALGSFMNVVVYRMPAGQSIVHPPSRCPACGHLIRWRHNVPVLGWLILGGRCHDCRAPISRRYPLVEALVAGVFMALACGEIVFGGVNLPHYVPREEAIASPAAWAIYAFHLLLLGSLICAALIEYDANLLPMRLVTLVLAIGVFAPLALSDLRPVTAGLGTESSGTRLLDFVAGVLAGVVMRTAGWPSVFEVMDRRAKAAQPRSERRAQRRRKLKAELNGDSRRQVLATIYFPLVAVGVFLGWQAAIAVGFLATMLQFTAALAGNLWPLLRRPPLSTWQCLVAIGYLLTWNHWASWVPLLGGWHVTR